MGISQRAEAALGWALGLGCVLSMAIAPLARAQTGVPLRVQWSAPDGCPSVADVEAKIRSRLPTIDPALSVGVDAVVTRTRERAYLVHIQLTGALTGDRTLEAESCAAAADATALLVALAIDPTRARQEPVVAPNQTTELNGAAEATPRSEPSLPEDAETEDAKTDRAETEVVETDDAATDNAPEATEAADADADDDPLVLRLGVGAGVPIDWGTTPGLTSGALLFVSLSVNRVLLVVSGSWLVSRETTIAPGATLSAGWRSVALDGCYLAGVVTQWGPCLGLDLGQLTSTSSGLVGSVNRNEFALFATGSVIARARLTPALYASLSVGMRTSVWYPRLVVAGIGDSFQPATIGLRATFALTLVLG